MKQLLLASTFLIWYPIGMLLYVLVYLPINGIYGKFGKGEWLPEEGRYKNLLYGQWRKCNLFNEHNFVDPRIDPVWIKKEKQKWEKCTDCGYEREI